MAERTNISEKDRHLILSEAGYCCAVPTCGTTLAMDLHHILEVRHGGGNELSNLIALCPTHHALYHRGIIANASIAAWKQRLVAINEVGSDTINKVIGELLRSSISRDNKGAEIEFTGFPLAAAEFMQRTCEIGFLGDGDGEIFFKTGLCCFIKTGLALTVGPVVDAAKRGAQIRNGNPVIQTMRGMAPFEVQEKFDMGNLILLKMGKIDDKFVKSALAGHDPDVAEAFYEPLQTDVKYRIVPFVGESVGFLCNSSADGGFRSAINPFCFESRSVSFLAKTNAVDGFAQYVLTPSLSGIENEGAPVFTEDGRLVGLVRDNVQMGEEIGIRPVITGVIPLRSLITPPPS
jgi:hypothetical protein